MKCPKCQAENLAASVYCEERGASLEAAYFEVTTRLTADDNLLWNFDLFQNAITAAVDD